MTAMQVVNLSELPVGSELSFVSTRRNRFRVRIIGGDGPRYGHGRMVEVLEAPIEYRGATVMCVTPPNVGIELMAHVYRHSKTTIMTGDVVYIIDEIGTDSTSWRGVRPFYVRVVTVSTPSC